MHVHGPRVAGRTHMHMRTVMCMRMPVPPHDIHALLGMHAGAPQD